MGNDVTVQYIIVIIKVLVVSPRFVQEIILQSSYIIAVQSYTVTIFKTKGRNYSQSRPPLFGTIAFRTFSDRPEPGLNIVLNPFYKIWQVVITELACLILMGVHVKGLENIKFILFTFSLFGEILKKNVVSIYFYLNQNSNEIK